MHTSIREMNYSLDTVQYIRDKQHGETLTRKEKLEVGLIVLQGEKIDPAFPSLVAKHERMMLVRALQLFFIELIFARNSGSVISSIRK